MTTKKQFLEDMKRLGDLTKKYDIAVIQLRSVGFSPVANIFDASERAFMALADMIADKHDIHRDALSWFVNENDFGNQQFQSQKHGCDKAVKIKNAADFWMFEKEITK